MQKALYIGLIIFAKNVLAVAPTIVAVLIKTPEAAPNAIIIPLADTIDVVIAVGSI